MIVTRINCIDILKDFLDRIYRHASKEHSFVLSRNHGHYDYPGGGFCVYVTIFPSEIELVFEGKQVKEEYFKVGLDICTPDGEILNGNIISTSGSCGEIENALKFSEASVLAKLSRLLK